MLVNINTPSELLVDDEDKHSFLIMKMKQFL